MRVAVVGLGKLGAPLAAVLASKGNDVLGIDVSPEAVRRLDDGLAPVEEPGLQELVTANAERLAATTELDAFPNRFYTETEIADLTERAGFGSIDVTDQLGGGFILSVRAEAIP